MSSSGTEEVHSLILKYKPLLLLLLLLYKLNIRFDEEMVKGKDVANRIEISMTIFEEKMKRLE